MVLGKSLQAHQRTIMHSNTRQAKSRQAHQRTIMHSNTRQALNASTRSVYAKWYWVNHGRLTSERKAYLPLPIVTHQSLDPAARALKRQASCLLRVDAFATPANNHALEHSTGSERVDAFGLREMVLGKSRQAHQRTQSFLYAKWYWVNHCRLTSERKAYLPLPIVTHQSLYPRPAALELKRQASCLCVRVDAFATRRRGNHMHDHSRFQRDIDWRHRRLSLSLSLSLYYSQKSLTHNIGNASAFPIIQTVLYTLTTATNFNAAE